MTSPRPPAQALDPKMATARAMYNHAASLLRGIADGTPADDPAWAPVTRSLRYALRDPNVARWIEEDPSFSRLRTNWEARYDEILGKTPQDFDADIAVTLRRD